MAKDQYRHFLKEDTHVANKHVKNVLDIISHHRKANRNYEMPPSFSLRWLQPKGKNKCWQECGKTGTLKYY